MPRPLIGVDQAGARGGVVGVTGKDGLAQPDAQHDAAVPDWHVGIPVRAHLVGRAAELWLLDQAEQVYSHRAQSQPFGVHAHRLASCPSCNQLAKLAPGSVTKRNASAGPLISELGPGPCPNSKHCPVEITPMVRYPGSAC